MTMTPNNATILKDGQEVKVTLDEIKKVILLFANQVKNSSWWRGCSRNYTYKRIIYNRGECTCKREVGSKVIAGSINYEGTIQYRAEKIGKESTVSEIVKLVAQATSIKAPIAKIADKISGYFVPTVLVIAIIIFGIWLIISKDFLLQ